MTDKMKSLVKGILVGLAGKPLLLPTLPHEPMRWLLCDVELGNRPVVIEKCDDVLFAYSLLHGSHWISYDGKTWIKKGGCPSTCYSMVYGNGIFIFYAYADTIYITTDLENYTKISVFSEETNYIDDCEYHNGVFVMTPSDSDVPHYSLDGFNWTPCEIDWDTRGHLDYHNGMWFICGASSFYSYDGITWHKAIGVDHNTSTDIVCGDGVYIVSPSSSSLAECEYYYSTDGIHWSKKNIVGTAEAFSFKYVNGLWFASRLYDGMYYSIDGLNWEQTNIVEHGIGPSNGPITYGNGVWVVALYDASGNRAGIWYSEDGANWYQSNATDDVSGATYVEGMFFGGRYYSMDAITWEKCDIDMDFIYAPVYHNGVFVRSAYNGNAFTATKNGLFYHEVKEKGNYMAESEPIPIYE